MTGVEVCETLDGTPEDVWPIVSDPELLREWLDDDVELTPEVGAPLRTRGERGTRIGVIDDVEIGRRLVFTWMPCEGDAGPVTTVELELEGDDEGGHTVVRIRERVVDFDVDLGARSGLDLGPRALARC